jgi:triphosphatase
MREVELKFELSPAAARTLLRSPEFRGAEAHKLHAIYFDTSDHRLAAHRMALRVRDEGGRWVQALKAGRSGEAGLHAREEWEWPRPEASIDRKVLRATPLAKVVNGRDALAAVFEVRMERRAADLDLGGGNRVEIALDRGDVRRGRKRAPLCELEIESKAGDPLAVFDAAERFVERVPLRASMTSKAQRGYELARARRAVPMKAVRVVLSPDDSVDAGARRIVAAALAQLQGNEAHATHPNGHEFLHQFRVGLRRLRSAVRVFEDAFPAGTARLVRDDCRWLSRLTGEARDLDVFVMKMLPRLLRGAPAGQRRALAAAARRRRSEARGRLREALASPRYTRFVLRFARWIAAPPPDEARGLRDMAAAVLQRQHRKAVRASQDASTLAPAPRHRVRVRLKRLRYACESLASLFTQASDEYVGVLEKLQDDLGHAADARAAMARVKSLDWPREATRDALARLRKIEDASLRDIDAHAAALRDAPVFWIG